MNKLFAIMLFSCLNLIPLYVIASEGNENKYLAGKNVAVSGFLSRQYCLRATYALHTYAKDGKIENLKEACEKYALNVNTQDDYGCTPSHCAAECGQQEALHYLVVHGADLTIRNSKQQTPFDVATVEIRQYLKELAQQSAKN